MSQGKAFFNGFHFDPESTKQVVASYYILYFYVMLSYKAQANTQAILFKETD